MKKLVLLFPILALCSVLRAQDIDKDVAALSIRVVQPEREFLTSDVCRQLETKMEQLLTANGVVNDLPSNRFIITAKANILSKDIIAGSPSRVSLSVEFTFIIGDCLDNKKYGTCTFVVPGVGLNENKALLMAVKSIKQNNENLIKFVSDSKKRIVQYYIDNEQKILAEADKLMAEGKYNEALYYLSMVPDACGECYKHCEEKMLSLISRKVDEDGQKLFNEAKAIWAAHPNSSGADELYPLISAIDSRSACYKEVETFMASVTKKLMADEKKAWEFKLQQYQDAKAKEQRDFEFSVQQYQDKKAREERDFNASQEAAAREAVIRQQEINAARDVAMEYAKNQPKEVYYETNNIILW